jgi:hypothetical protein
VLAAKNGNYIVGGLSGSRDYNFIQRLSGLGSPDHMPQHGVPFNVGKHFTRKAGGTHARLNDCHDFRMFRHALSLESRRCHQRA